jgi:hypothetical protein
MVFLKTIYFITQKKRWYCERGGIFREQLTIKTKKWFFGD